MLNVSAVDPGVVLKFIYLEVNKNLSETIKTADFHIPLITSKLCVCDHVPALYGTFIWTAIL